VAANNTSAAGGTGSPEVTTTIQLVEGDTVTCGTWQNTGVSQTGQASIERTAFGAARLY